MIEVTQIYFLINIFHYDIKQMAGYLTFMPCAEEQKPCWKCTDELKESRCERWSRDSVRLGAAPTVTRPSAGVFHVLTP